MALSVSCCFDLDIGSFFTSRSTNLVIPEGYKRGWVQEKKMRCTWMMDYNLTRAAAIQWKQSEFSFKRGKDEREQSRDHWLWRSLTFFWQNLTNFPVCFFCQWVPTNPLSQKPKVNRWLCLYVHQHRCILQESNVYKFPSTLQNQQPNTKSSFSLLSLSYFPLLGETWVWSGSWCKLLANTRDVKRVTGFNSCCCVVGGLWLLHKIPTLTSK